MAHLPPQSRGTDCAGRRADKLRSWWLSPVGRMLPPRNRRRRYIALLMCRVAGKCWQHQPRRAPAASRSKARDDLLQQFADALRRLL
jgi:hypothetical protein